MFAAAAPAELAELRLGLREPFCGVGAVLFELLASRVADVCGGGAGLVERERLGGRGSERPRDPCWWVGAVGFTAVGFPLERLACEVEAGLCPCAGAGDVAPLCECALVVEQDEGAFDGGALGGVAGEGVAVLEVLGRVARVERAEGAAVGPQRERLRADVDDGCADAVADAEALVVAAAEDAVADAELATAGLERARARAGRPG